MSKIKIKLWPNKRQWNHWSIGSRLIFVTSLILIISFIWELLGQLVDTFNNESLCFQFEETSINNTQTEINYFISNKYSKGTLVVDDMYLLLIDSKKSNITFFPDKPGALIKNYKYEVELNTFKNKYSITNDKFKYSPGEVDHFSIKIKSEERYIYTCRLIISYFRLSSPYKKHLIKSEPIVLGDKYKIPIKEILKNAKSIYFYLNTNSSIDYFFDDLFFRRGNFYFKNLKDNNIYDRRNCTFKFVLPDILYDNIPIEFKLNEYGILRESYNIIPSDVYNQFNVIQGDSALQNYKQFIIYNDSLVIQNIRYWKGRIINDTDEVRHYLDYFDKCFRYKSTFKLTNVKIRDDFLLDLNSTKNYSVISFNNHYHKYFCTFDSLSSLIWITAQEKNSNYNVINTDFMINTITNIYSGNFDIFFDSDIYLNSNKPKYYFIRRFSSYDDAKISFDNYQCLDLSINDLKEDDILNDLDKYGIHNNQIWVIKTTSNQFYKLLIISKEWYEWYNDHLNIRLRVEWGRIYSNKT